VREKLYHKKRKKRMQFDPDTRHIHTLFFETEAAARAAHSHVMRLVASQFDAWSVQKGGKRTFVVLDRPTPASTWQYLFATTGPLTDSKINQIHLATGADEGQWNQV
jgi:hypothetical protein